MQLPNASCGSCLRQLHISAAQQYGCTYLAAPVALYAQCVSYAALASGHSTSTSLLTV
jgi:hypothetical protein